MDKQLIAGRFGKAVASYDKEAVVQRRIADKMVELLERHLDTRCGRVTEVGCGTGLFSRSFLRRFTPDEWLLNDICPEMERAFDGMLTDRVRFLAGDAECMDLPCIQDLIVSCSALQWFVSPARFFRRCHARLSEDGYLAFSTFGGRNMEEIASVTGQSLAYLSKEELEKMLLPGYRLVWSEEELITLEFGTPLDVLRHLKLTGVTGICSRSWTKGDLTAFCELYNGKFGRAGSVPLTYHPIYIIVKKEKS